MTQRAGRLPAPVTTASPIAQPPIRSHSSWIDFPPRLRIAPATPAPSWRPSFAGFTIASTRASVMSRRATSIRAGTENGSPASRAQALLNRLGDPQERVGHGRLRLRGDDGDTGVSADRDRRVEGDRAEKGHVQLLRRALASAVLEDLLAMPAFRAEKVGRVLDDPEHRYVDLLKHRKALPRVDERDVLRGRDDDRARQVDLLRQGELRVSRAGRQVDDEKVELAPRHVLQKLLHGLHHHRAPPDDALLHV